MQQTPSPPCEHRLLEVCHAGVPSTKNDLSELMDYRTGGGMNERLTKRPLNHRSIRLLDRHEARIRVDFGRRDLVHGCDLGGTGTHLREPITDPHHKGTYDVPRSCFVVVEAAKHAILRDCEPEFLLQLAKACFHSRFAWIHGTARKRELSRMCAQSRRSFREKQTSCTERTAYCQRDGGGTPCPHFDRTWAETGQGTRDSVTFEAVVGGRVHTVEARWWRPRAFGRSGLGGQYDDRYHP